MFKHQDPFFKNSPSGLFFYVLHSSHQSACHLAKLGAPLISWLFLAYRLAVRTHRIAIRFACVPGRCTKTSSSVSCATPINLIGGLND
jgi:hypothetical protein